MDGRMDLTLWQRIRFGLAGVALAALLSGCPSGESETYRDLGEEDDVVNTSPDDHHHHHDAGPHGGWCDVRRS